MMLALIGGDFSSTTTDEPALSVAIFWAENTDVLAIRTSEHRRREPAKSVARRYDGSPCGVFPSTHR